MPRTALLSLVAGVILVAVLGGLYLAQPNPLAQRVRELEAELSKAQKEIARIKVEREPVAPAPAQPAPSVVASLAAKTALLTTSDKVRQLPDEAARREAMFKYHETGIEREYGRLFKQLGLNDEEMNYFKHLLAERRSRSMELLIKSGGSGLTKEEKEAARQERLGATQASDAAIKLFLNNDADYAAYKQWEDTTVERMQIQQAVTNFDAAGETISGPQRDQLFDLMLSLRITPEQRASMGTASKSKADMQARFDQRREADEQRLMQQAAAFLTPGQLSVLQRMQQKQRDYRNTQAAANPPKAGVP